MKISANLLVALSVVATLTACSSGGSSSEVHHTTTSVVNSTGSSTTTSTIVLNEKIKGNQIKLDSQNKAGANQAIVSAPSTSSVVVDGKKIDFDLSGFSAANTINMSANNIVRIGSGDRFLNDSRFGYLKEGVNGTPVLLSQGNATTNMPTTGKATYTGYAAHVSGGATSLVPAKFDVDYGAKKVAGTINAASGNVNLSGAITGNHFSGIQSGISTQGYFYGDAAKELGGTYKNTDGTVSGAYGAKK